MNNIRPLNRNFELAAWGAVFVWWGITELLPALPPGVGALGLGLILLGLNAARSVNGIPVSGFSITLGVLAAVLGGLQLAASLLGLPFQLPVFPILLIVLGAILLARDLLRTSPQSPAG